MVSKEHHLSTAGTLGGEGEGAIRVQVSGRRGASSTIALKTARRDKSPSTSNARPYILNPGLGFRGEGPPTGVSREGMGSGTQRSNPWITVLLLRGLIEVTIIRKPYYVL